MAKEAHWHSKTMALPGASLVGGDERVYHDNDLCPAGQRIPVGRREDGTGKDLKQCPTCAALGARAGSRAEPSQEGPVGAASAAQRRNTNSVAQSRH
jgi:hypothetical protein